MSRIWNPFRSLVWPGLGPTVDWARAWPEPVVIAAGVLLYGRGAPLEGHLSLLLAGLGAWWLGVVLGIGQLGRTWTGLTFVFAGAAATVFGQDQSVSAAGYAWMPWTLAWGLAAIQEQRRLYAAFAAVALALMLLGSGYGFVLSTMLLLAFLILCSALRPQVRPRPSVRLAWRPASTAVIVTVLGLGLAAVRLLPTLAAGAATPGPTAALSAADLGLRTLLAAFFVKPASPATLGVYVGSLPLLFLVGLLWGGQRKPRQPLWGLGALGILALMAAASGWLTSGRLSVALLAWATLSVVMLAGAGLDAAWTQARANTSLSRVRVPEAVAWAAARVGVVALPGLAVWAVSHLYLNNRPLLVAASRFGGQLAVADLLHFDLARHPVAFWIGVAMSTVSFVGVLTLIIGDQRARRHRIETEAVYEAGALRPIDPIDLPDGTPVHVTVEPAGRYAYDTEVTLPEFVPALSAPTPASSAPEVAPAVVPVPAPTDVALPFGLPILASTSAVTSRTGSKMGQYWPWLLFALALGVYLVTRFWSIEHFPIYFFTDEAANPLFAQDLIARNFRGVTGERFPLYFEVAANRWGPLLSVYLHGTSMTLFGKSVLVTRGTQALLSVLAAIAIGLSLKFAFRARFWWAGVLLLAVAPTWFLHSRTGFETIIAASFYGCFILFYLLYRIKSPRYLYLALLFGGMTFYTYSNGQMIMAAAGVLLGLFDIRYHIKNWRVTLPGLLLVGVLMLPALRFRAAHPGLLETHLRILNSYWFYDLSLTEKLAQFIKTYTHGLSVSYWFLPSAPRESYEVRHLMQGYGNLAIWTLPFFLIGVGVSLWRAVKGSAPYRILLLTALASPVGAALAQIALTRVMAFVVPATILIAVGLEMSLDVVRRKASDWVLMPIVFVALTAPALLMTRDALVNGPLWYRDYELYGMQYGATQLFGDEIPSYLADHPDSRIIVSPTWANGTDNFVRFFLSQTQQARVQMLNVDYFMVARRPLEPSMIFVMTQAEFERAQASDKFQSVDVVHTIPYPDGRTGFYFVRLAYAPNLDEILDREREERSRPVAAQIELDGQIVDVLHSQFDIGLLPNVFDGDTFTLVRGLEANPLVFDFSFPQPRSVSRLQATFASMDFTLTVSLYSEGAIQPTVYSETYRGLPPDPTVELVFDRGPQAVDRIRLEILQLNAGVEVHIHVRELKFE